MTRESIRSLSIAATALALLSPAFAHAQIAQAQESSNTPDAARIEAAQMVPAKAVLTTTLDTAKMQPGYQFQATLAKTIQLKNGPELPSGTVLIGTVVADEQAGTRSSMALRFTLAKVKNGGEVPIKATIAQVFPPHIDYGVSHTPDAADNPGNAWDPNTLVIDQIDAVSGGDLHSRIAGADSGVFVSTTKPVMKLPAQSEMVLAIAAQGSSQQAQAGAGGY
jgi:hypothetical protein